VTILEEFVERVTERGSRASKRVKEHCERMVRTDTPLNGAVSWDLLKSCAAVEECNGLLSNTQSLPLALDYLYRRLLALSTPTNSMTAALANEARRDIAVEMIGLLEEMEA